MALWIYAAIALTALVPILIGMGIGTRAGRKRGDLRQGIRKGALAGAVVGVVLVAVTFFDHVLFATHVEFELPHGFAHDWVILVDDRHATHALDWNPLTRRAYVRVPRSGIVRLRGLDALDGPSIRATVRDGEDVRERMQRTVSTSNGDLRILGFVVVPGDPADRWDNLDDDVAAARIAAADRER